MKPEPFGRRTAVRSALRRALGGRTGVPAMDQPPVPASVATSLWVGLVAVGRPRPGVRLPQSRAAGPRRRALHPVLPRGRRRLRRTAAAACAALALVAAMVVGTPRLLLALGAPTMVRTGVLTPSWTVPAAFIRPGIPVAMPSGGRLLGLLGPGLVAAGARLALFTPAVPVRPETAYVGTVHRGPGRLPAPGAASAAPAALVCLRQACAAPESPAPVPADPVSNVPAQGAGWFSPGWDPLAALPPVAYSDLPPWAVLLPVAPAPLPGTQVAGGVTLGTLGASWSGYWLCVLPAAARLALRHAADATIRWAGGRGSMAVHPAGTGPTVAGRIVGIFAAGALGPDPGPPVRATVKVTLPPVSGQIIPSGALLHAGAEGGRTAVVVVAGAGRWHLQRVRLEALVGRRAVVAGLEPGMLVLADPGGDPQVRGASV